MKKFLFVIVIAVILSMMIYSCVFAEEPKKDTYICEQTGMIQITFPVQKRAEITCTPEDFGCPNQKFEDTFKRELLKMTLGMVFQSPITLDHTKIPPANCTKKKDEPKPEEVK